jgi:hypothetical protein
MEELHEPSFDGVAPEDVEQVEDKDVIYHGAPLDEERVEGIVAGLRRRARNLTPGGKSLSLGKRRSPVVQVTLPEDIHEIVVRRAAEQGMSVSKYTRELIERAVR